MLQQVSKVGKATLKTVDTLTFGVAGKLTSAIESTLFDRLIQKLSFQGKITLITLPLTILALIGAASLSMYVYEDYKRTSLLETANTVSDYFIAAGAQQAQERGLAAVLLLQSSATTQMNTLVACRAQGDALLDSALKHLEKLEKNALISNKIARLQNVRTARNEFRTRIDALLGKRGGAKANAQTIRSWRDVQTRLIMASHDVSAALFMTARSPVSYNPLGPTVTVQATLEFNSELKLNAFLANEYAARERAVVRTLLSNDAPATATEIQELQRYRSAIEESLSTIAENATNPYISQSSKSAIRRMQDVYERSFEQPFRAIVLAVSSGQPSPVALDEWLTRSTDAINAISAVAELASADMQATTRQEHNRALRNVVIIVTLLVALLLIILFSRRIGKSLLIPVLMLRNAAKAIEAGDVQQRIQHSWRDELGDLANSFNRMAESIQQNVESLQSTMKDVEREQRIVERTSRMIEKQREYLADSIELMLRSVEEFAKGDLTQELEAKKADDISNLFNGYNLALQSVRQMMLQISDSINSTAESSMQIAANTDQMFRNIYQQAGQVGEISSAIEEMTNTIAESTRQTSSAAEKSIQVSREALEGGDTIQKLISGLNTISDIVVRSSESVQKLGRNSVQIGEIAHTIEEIADQTNLLALNAAIEAARAGDSGRGFAVVADEVRKLAERTQQATRQIGVSLKEIQSDTNKVIDVMDTGMQQAELGKNYIAGASASLQNIIYHTAEVADIMSQLASSAEQQSATSNEIASTVNTMSSAITEAAKSIEDIASTVGEVSSKATDLQRQMRQFKV